MNQLTFDTLEFVRTLEKGGFDQKQADALAQAQKRALSEMVASRDVASKKDILALKNDILAFKSDMIKWFLGTTLTILGFMVGGFALVLTILKP